MKVRHDNGTVVEAPVGKAKRLVATGSWQFVAPSLADVVKVQLDIEDESSAEAAERHLGIQDTPEPVQEPTEAPKAPEVASKPAPTIEEMRKWSQDNGVEGIKDKGKLPRRAIDAYLDAHKD